MTAYGGTQKITMGRDKRQNRIDAENALRQAGRNAYVEGVESGLAGVGEAARGSRRESQYGNVNIQPTALIQGPDSFAYTDSPGNQPNTDRLARTGSVDTQVSSTIVPQQDPDAMEAEGLQRALTNNFETEKLEKRLYNMAKGGQGFPGLNNRPNVNEA